MSGFHSTLICPVGLFFRIDERELARWHDREGNLTRTVDELLSLQAFHHEVAIQVAVEVLYGDPQLREHVRDPIVAQTVLDALYYPAREWREGRYNPS